MGYLWVAAPQKYIVQDILIPHIDESGKMRRAFIDYQNKLPHRVYILR